MGASILKAITELMHPKLSGTAPATWENIGVIAGPGRPTTGSIYLDTAAGVVSCLIAALLFWWFSRLCRPRIKADSQGRRGVGQIILRAFLWSWFLIGCLLLTYSIIILPLVIYAVLRLDLPHPTTDLINAISSVLASTLLAGIPAYFLFRKKRKETQGVGILAQQNLGDAPKIDNTTTASKKPDTTLL